MRAIQYYKKLLSLSIPVLFSSISTLLANILLTTIVGHHSIEAMVVVGSATGIMLIFNNSLYASCIGYRICFSKALGEQNYKNLNSIFCSGLIFGLIISCFFSSILLIFAKQFTYYIKLNYIQSQQATNYLTVIAFSYIPQSITLILLFTFSIYEFTKFFLYINGIFSLLNIFINITLIYGLLIFPTLGFMGAAWSHSITTLLSFITVFLLFIRYNKNFNLKLLMDRNYLSLLFRLSYPSII
ncbi:MAG TPA: hypothetical protein LFV90_05925 [Rickettsia endosymbiont of Columbicola hoogstraali]|nr:hypothetical protein [Rickettsia endosymbiont of Columbicola hoogstraali]